MDRKDKSTEDTITIVYQPQAIFRVRAVTRCTSTLTGNHIFIYIIIIIIKRKKEKKGKKK